MKSKKQKISDPAAKPEARLPFFAKNLDQEALRSVRAGDGDLAQEVRDKANRG